MNDQQPQPIPTETAPTVVVVRPGTPEKELHVQAQRQRKKSADSTRNNGAFLYAVVIVIVLAITVVGAVAQPASAPMICSMGTAIAAAMIPIAKSQYDIQKQNQEQIEIQDETHRAVNGKMAQMLEIVGASEHAKGKLEEKEETAAKVASESGIGMTKDRK